jgi:hypothetical protein
MLQPFVPFKRVYIDQLRDRNKRYLVAQSYYRADGAGNEDGKLNILLTEYDTRPQAEAHRRSINNDPFAYILDLEIPSHRARLVEITSDPASDCALYWAVVESAARLEKRLNKEFKNHMRRYIDTRTNWQLDRGTTLYPSVQVQFGELVVILKHGSRTLRIKLEDVENA